MNGNGNVKQAIVISDLHAGDRTGLCHKNGVPLDDGGVYMPSGLQLKVFEWWEEMWGEWVPRVTRRQPFAIIINGDAIEGEHHRSKTPFSVNVNDQIRAAALLIQPLVKLCEGRLYMIRGTEAHAGKSGEHEETLAKMVGAVPDENGQYARWEMIARIGNRLAHIKHKIGTTQSMAYQHTALSKAAMQLSASAAQWNYEIYDWICRSHRHRYSRCENRTYHGEQICVVTPGWQLRTPFIYSMSGDDLPEFGCVLLRAGDEEHYCREYVKTITRTPEVVL